MQSVNQNYLVNISQWHLFDYITTFHTAGVVSQLRDNVYTSVGLQKWYNTVSWRFFFVSHPPIANVIQLMSFFFIAPLFLWRKCFRKQSVPLEAYKNNNKSVLQSWTSTVFNWTRFCSKISARSVRSLGVGVCVFRFALRRRILRDDFPVFWYFMGKSARGGAAV